MYPSVYPKTGRLGQLRGLVSAVMFGLLASGCAANGRGTPASDKFGRTYYIDGAGNWGFGVTEVRNGLRRAGYKGNIINYRWSPTFNPALDQTIGRPAARARGADLGREISAYLEKYPGNGVNIICLSAGTGVGVWACENITSETKLHALVMLGSSLSSDYDMHQVLQNIAGGVWVYYSPYDRILQGPVRSLGTIDGKLGVEAVGTVGLRYRGPGSEKIHNIRWSPRYERYGWTGAHTDATSEPMVEQILARHILTAPGPNPADELPAATTETAADRPIVFTGHLSYTEPYN